MSMPSTRWILVTSGLLHEPTDDVVMDTVVVNDVIDSVVVEQIGL
jgi:hypothetical protein